jgi:hypothetical protein
LPTMKRSWMHGQMPSQNPILKLSLARLLKEKIN